MSCTTWIFFLNKGFKNSSFIKHQFKFDILAFTYSLENNISSIYHSTLVPLTLIIIFLKMLRISKIVSSNQNFMKEIKNL
jgi:hypothetical protein